ncbi:hypothetical protein CJO78_22325 (plasmid) [Ralstonia solanacearum]|nr:hypothetical protein CJO78_22325 [Ralstonia solanacearum]AXW08940.1 hypothetical protein CJO82_21995 [Ralstonia solanacearum]AXW26733.1 hypothetical protein CJO86_22260 [Ralstonia solanacearum]AXW83643.1 hypothetical protein CJO98_22355 [Ralstonia solanacearum]
MPVREGGRVQFTAVARWHLQDEGVSEASQHNGADERISMRQLNIDNERHTKPSKLTKMDETRVGPHGHQAVMVDQMVMTLRERMHSTVDPDEAAEIREALAEHKFPESLVYEAKHSGLRTEENRAAVVARFYEWAADDAELAKDDAQHEHPATGEAR